MTISGNAQVQSSNDVGQTDLQATEFQANRRAQAFSVAVEDRARFSANVAQTQRLRDAVAAQPEVRHDRVAQVRAAVVGGSYQVSNQQIANAIGDEYAPT